MENSFNNKRDKILTIVTIIILLLSIWHYGLCLIIGDRAVIWIAIYESMPWWKKECPEFAKIMKQNFPEYWIFPFGQVIISLFGIGYYQFQLKKIEESQ